MKKHCKLCGNEFITVNNQKYCLNCQDKKKALKREYVNHYNKLRRARITNTPIFKQDNELLKAIAKKHNKILPEILSVIIKDYVIKEYKEGK